MDGSRPTSEAQKMTSPTMTGAERLVRCLEQHGVEHIFGLSGGAAMPMFDALVDSKIKLILVRHERARATWRTATRARPASPASCS
jgi:glyoxylate carboligase